MMLSRLQAQLSFLQFRFVVCLGYTPMEHATALAAETA